MKVFFIFMFFSYSLFAKETFILSIYSYHEELITDLIYALMVTVIVGSSTFIWYLYRSRRIIAKREADLVSISINLNKAQELSHLGNWVWDIKANTLWWSNEVYRIFGLIPQEFKATYEAFLERVHPDDREEVQAAINYAMTNHTEYSIVHRLIKMDGTIRYVHEEGSVDYEEPVKMNGTVQDITETFEKEEALLLQAQIFDAVQDSILVYDFDGKFIYLNENAWKTRGYTREEMMGMNISEIDINCNPKKRNAMMNQLKEVGYMKARVDHLCKNGNRLPVEMYVKHITLNKKSYILGSVRDISEQLIAQKEIEKFSKAVDQIDDSVLMTDRMGTITYVNQAFCDHTGFSREEAVGNNPRMLKSGQHDIDFFKNLWKIILHGDVFRVTLVNKKKNGDLFYENLTITPLKDENGDITGFVYTGKDVTSETMMNQEMERIATIDKLTGVFNRHKFEELYALESERSRRFSQPLSLILIDIDHFKNVNDTYGHDIGDKVLQLLVKIVQKNIRQIDIFARWGGEEFLVLSPSTNFENIQILAEKLRLAIAEAEFPEISHITISQGVSVFEEKDTFSELFKRADKGLYYAKEHGRNQVGITVK
ncbi:MAG: diguanylate cyclase [Sulfuricurvum sp.]|nr:diguanylate cyclase [Sulfuricurvum sp.]